MTARHVLSFAAAMLLPLQAAAAETLWTEVTVRVYDATGAAANARRASLEIAASIVSAASVELVWRHCNPPSGHVDATSDRAHANPCDLPLRPSELAVRIVRSGAVDDQARDLPLGDALVNTRTGCGTCPRSRSGFDLVSCNFGFLLPHTRGRSGIHTDVGRIQGHAQHGQRDPPRYN